MWLLMSDGERKYKDVHFLAKNVKHAGKKERTKQRRVNGTKKINKRKPEREKMERYSVGCGAVWGVATGCTGATAISFLEAVVALGGNRELSVAVELRAASDALTGGSLYRRFPPLLLN